MEITRKGKAKKDLTEEIRNKKEKSNGIIRYLVL